MSGQKTNFEPEDILDGFIRMYGGKRDEVGVFAAPARINIIGEHIDYNGGRVFPAAIDKYLYIAIRKRDNSAIFYNDMRFDESFTFDINNNFLYNKKDSYANYLNGILAQLKESGHKFHCGFDILIASNIPAGGGISSSSALECAFAYAISETYGFNIDKVEIAKLGQMSEHKFMRVNCGIMDQFIIANGKKGTAMLLNCDTLENEYIPLNLGDYKFVVMNTNKERKLADSKYNERRSECEQVLEIFAAKGLRLKNLCSLDPAHWEKFKSKLDAMPDLQKRAKHCVFENQRVKDAVEALKANNLKKLGQLLNESHESLKNDYEVTGQELDVLTAAARAQEGCLGTRMTGAGFGGCAIAIVHQDLVPEFIKNVGNEYYAQIGYDADFFACSSGDGVRRVTIE